MEETKKKVGAPEGNKNAEKWTLGIATKFLEDAIDKAMTLKTEEGNPEYDFIGELTTDMGYHKTIFRELVEKFPKELTHLHNRLLGIFESNCFRNTKRGKIKEATGIVNLKSNYQWKDRQDITTGGEKLTSAADAIAATQNGN